MNIKVRCSLVNLNKNIKVYCRVLSSSVFKINKTCELPEPMIYLHDHTWVSNNLVYNSKIYVISLILQNEPETIYQAHQMTYRCRTYVLPVGLISIFADTNPRTENANSIC